MRFCTAAPRPLSVLHHMTNFVSFSERQKAWSCYLLVGSKWGILTNQKRSRLKFESSYHYNATSAGSAISFLSMIGDEVALFSISPSLSMSEAFPSFTTSNKISAANHRKSGSYANPDFLWLHGCCGNTANLQTTPAPFSSSPELKAQIRGWWLLGLSSVSCVRHRVGRPPPSTLSRRGDIIRVIPTVPPPTAGQNSAVLGARKSDSILENTLQ